MRTTDSCSTASKNIAAATEIMLFDCTPPKKAVPLALPHEGLVPQEAYAEISRLVEFRQVHSLFESRSNISYISGPNFLGFLHSDHYQSPPILILPIILMIHLLPQPTRKNSFSASPHSPCYTHMPHTPHQAANIPPSPAAQSDNSPNTTPHSPQTPSPQPPKPL